MAPMDAQEPGKQVAAVGWIAGSVLAMGLVWRYFGSAEYLLIVGGAAMLGLVALFRRVSGSN